MFSKIKSFTHSEDVTRNNIVILFLLTVIISVGLSFVMTLNTFRFGNINLIQEISYFLGNSVGRISSITGIPFFFLYFGKNNIWRALGWLIWVCFIFLYIVGVEIEML